MQKMAAKKKTIAQTSLEYLVTYGWAMVLIATIIGVLIFAAGGSINTNSCTTFLQMICKGIGADGDTLVLVLQNATGQRITINPFVDIKFDEVHGYAIVTYQGNTYRFEDVTISPGDEFKIEGQGMALSDQLSVTFYEHETGLTRTITSNLSTEAPPTIEISNDGIDNDGDGLVDCEDDPTECEYLGAPTSGTNPCSDNCTITFGALETSRAAQLGGIWTKDSITLVVYVSTHQSATTAHITHETISSAPQTVNQGWNEFPVTMSGQTYDGDAGPNLGDVILGVDSGGFTILQDSGHRPKALAYLDDWP